MRILTLLSCLALHAASANDAKLRVVQEIWVPESWAEPELTGGVTAGNGARTGISFKPATPEFRRRETGVSIGIGSVTVHPKPTPKIVRKRQLRLPDGRVFPIRGKYLRIDKTRFEVIGQIGDHFYLRDDRTKRHWRFQLQPAANSDE